MALDLGRSAASREVSSNFLVDTKKEQCRDANCDVFISSGIQCPCIVSFTKWTPGKKCIKVIVVKNVRFKAVKISCSKPSGYFQIKQYIDNAIVSPGTTLQIPVYFFPDEETEYNDELLITVNQDTNIFIPLQGTPPSVDLQVPNKVNLGVLAVNTTVNKIVPMHNNCKFSTTWKVEAPPSFRLSPEFGVLEANQTQSLTIDFFPTHAGTFNSSAIIKYDSNNGAYCGQIELPLHGIAKYPHITFDNDSRHQIIDFGQHRIGTTVSETIHIINHSYVDTAYMVRHSFLGESCLKLYGNTGLVKAKSQLEIKIAYTSSHHYHHCNEHFLFSFTSGPQLRLTCKGNTLSPSVLCKTTHIDFGTVHRKTSIKRQVTLQNIGDIEARLSWISPNAGAMHLIPCRGTCVVKPLETINLEVCFVPQEEFHYYREFEIAVEDHAPIIVEVIGRGIENNNAKEQRVSISDAFVPTMERRTSGFPHIPPSQIQSLAACGLLTFKDGVWCVVDPPPQDPDPPVTERRTSSYSRDTSSQQQQQQDQSMTVPSPIHDIELTPLSTNIINFGQCPGGSKKQVMSISSRDFIITNESQGEVVCIWPDLSTFGMPFSITPLSAIIEPQGNVTFTVNFAPPVINKEYHYTVEATFNFVESAKTDNLELINLPWTSCIHLTGTTDTTKADIETMPSFAADPKIINIPATSSGMPGYGTFALINTSDVVAIIRVVPPRDSDELSLVPITRQHILLPRETCITSVKALPKKTDTVQATLFCFLDEEDQNDNGDDGMNLTVMVTSVDPLLRLNMSALTIGYITVGHPVTRSFCLQNICAISCFYEFECSGNSIQPKITGGSLEPNEEHEIEVIVSGKQAGVVEENITIRFGALPNKFTHQLSLPVSYDAQTPFIEPSLFSDDGRIPASTPCKRESSSSSLDSLPQDKKCAIFELNATPIMQMKRLELVITNTSNAFAYCRIRHDLARVITIHKLQVHLPPRCKQSIWIDVRPRYEDVEICHVYVDFLDVHEVSIIEQTEFVLEIRGIRPKLAIIDVRAEHESLTTLWEQLSIEDINTALTSNWNTNTQDDTPCNVDLGTRTHLSADTVVCLRIKNMSDCTCKWRALLPRDKTWDSTGWARDTSSLVNTKENNNSNGDNTKLSLDSEDSTDAMFDVEPQIGCLKAGETCMLKISFRHDNVGEHTIPLTLQENLTGSSVILLLHGCTLAAGLPFLQIVPSNVWHLKSVHLGMHSPPEQFMVLSNPTDVDASFRVDVGALSAMKEANHGFSVFSCRKPNGIVPAGSKVSVGWIFCPIEARIYHATIPIHVDGMDDSPILIALVGHGIDPRSEQADIRVYKKDETNRYNPAIEDEKDTIPNHNVCVSKIEQFELPDQPATLSQDIIDFGPICTHAIARHVLFIRNRVNSRVSFEFDSTLLGTELDISPRTGIIEPKQAYLCKLTIHASGQPCNVNDDLVITVRDYDGEKACEDQQRRNDESIKAAANSFTLTDKFRTGKGHSGAICVSQKLNHVPAARVDASAFVQRVLDPQTKAQRLSASSNESRPPSGSVRLLPVLGSKKVIVSDTDLRASKYQALPPICVKDKPHLTEVQTPSPPFRLYVRIRGRCLHPLDLGGHHKQKNFVCHSQGDSLRNPNGDSHTALHTWRHMRDITEDVEVAEDILLLIIREATSDITFISALTQIKNEQPPNYYSIRSFSQEEKVADEQANKTEIIFVEHILAETLCNVLVELEDQQFEIENQ